MEGRFGIVTVLSFAFRMDFVQLIFAEMSRTAFLCAYCFSGAMLLVHSGCHEQPLSGGMAGAMGADGSIDVNGNREPGKSVGLDAPQVQPDSSTDTEVEREPSSGTGGMTTTSPDAAAFETSGDRSSSADVNIPSDSRSDVTPSCWTRHFTLQSYVGPQIWTSLIRSAALDSQDRLYVSDGNSVFRVENGVPSSYLVIQDLIAAVGMPSPVVKRLATDGSGLLYLLVGDHQPFPAPGRVMTSAARSSVTTLFQLGSSFVPDLMTVRSEHEILITDSGLDPTGLYAIRDGQISLVYGPRSAQWGGDCQDRNMSVSEGGFLYYLPGCNGSSLVGGRDDGSGLGILARLGDLGEYYAWNFSGVGQDHQGGAVVGVEGVFYRFASDGTRIRLNITPAPTTFKTDLGLSGFLYATIVVSPSCDFYIVDNGTIYVARPDR